MILSLAQIQFLGLILDFIGAFLLIIPLVRKKKAIREESSTYVGYNPPLRKAMERDRPLGITGLVLLVVGFLLQIIALYPSL